MSSYLFPVQLRAAGTAEVEGLSSYLCRLSVAHDVPVGVLLRNCYSWYHRTSQVDEAIPYLARNPGSLAQYVRPNEMTRSLLKVLAAASGQSNLRSATFMCLEVAMARCMRTFFWTTRWCPMCMKEFEREGVEPYFKLYWSLTTFTHCMQHGAVLEHECPRCRARQDGHGARTSCARCARCDGSLGGARHWAQPSTKWQAEGADLIELLDRIGREPELHFPKHSVRRVLQRLFERSCARDELEKLWSLIPQDECMAIVFGQVAVTLTTARRIAYRLGLPLVDLLAEAIEETPGVLDPSWTSKLPTVMRPKRKAGRHDRKRLFAGIRNALTTSGIGEPISLTELARGLHVTTGCLRYHFPAEAKAILERYACWRRAERERKKLEARSAVVSYISRHGSSVPMTNKGALRDLRMKTRLPKDLLRREISNELNSETSSAMPPTHARNS